METNDYILFFASWAQIISLPVAIIAIIVSIWLYRKTKLKKAIACIFEEAISIIDIKTETDLDGLIEISYKNKPIKNLNLIRVRVVNTGNTTIRLSDIVEPLAFIFHPDTILIKDPKERNKKPTNLRIGWELVSINPLEIKCHFDLLNPKEEFTAEFLCTGNSSLPIPKARIEGISKIDNRYPPSEIEIYWFTKWMVRSSLLTAFPVSILLYYVYVNYRHSIPTLLILGMVILLSIFSIISLIVFLIVFKQRNIK